jgi:SPP1 gp7 family putative phage head morphogenesis protein
MTQEERTKLTREANMRIPGTTKPSADALIRLCELNDAYIDAVINELPKSGVPSKSIQPIHHKEKIEFNPRHLPRKNIVDYAERIRDEHPNIWKLGGNIFGNEAFRNLKRVSDRGYWLDSERWMYIKWRGYVARHQQDFRIEGVVAMLKWADEVSRGWAYMKELIEAEIDKREEKKEWDWGVNPYTCDHGCDHDHEPILKAYTPRQISDIERAFREAVGSSVVEALLDDEELWIAMAAGMDEEGAGSPLPPARESVSNLSAKSVAEEAKVTWEANYRRYGQRFSSENPIAAGQIVITPETEWMNKLNRVGFELVRDKIKKEYLPQIKQIVANNVAEQVPWNKIASNLRAEMQFGKRWDWVRLVRTEMKHASYIAQMEQNKATGVPFVRWSASRAGNTCPICQALNGRVFRLNGSTDMIYNPDLVDLASDKLYTCPPPAHPQCRCVQIPVWGKPKVQAPRPRLERITGT